MKSVFAISALLAAALCLTSPASAQFELSPFFGIEDIPTVPPVNEETASSLTNKFFFWLPRCSSETLRQGQEIRIENPSNGGSARVPPDSTCGLQFYGYRCTPRIECPCFNVAESSSCTNEFLEVSENSKYFGRRFCGTQGPNSGNTSFRSRTLKLRSRITTANRGFTCFVTCGSAWNRPANFQCPSSSSSTSTTAAPVTGSSTSAAGTATPGPSTPTGENPDP